MFRLPLRSRLMLILAWGSLSLSQAHAQEPLVLAPLIEVALANNPSLEVLQRRLDAIEAVIPTAGALDDPRLKFELSNVPLQSFNFASTPMSGKQLTLSQKLPYPGKRAAKERIVQQQAKVAKETYLDRKGELVQQVKQAYFRLAFLHRAIEITQKNEALMIDFIRIAKTKYSVGKGLQQDLLKAHVAQSDLKDQLIGLNQQRRRAEAQLNTVLNRPPQSPVGHPTPILQTAFYDSVESLQALLLAQRPQLKGLQEQAQRWLAVEDLARRQAQPDFDLSLGYRQRDLIASDPVKGRDFLSVGVTANLPIYKGRKQHQQRLEARLRRQAVQAEYETTKQQLFLQLQLLFIDQQAHRAQAELFKSVIIPQADQALSATLTGYQVGKVDFLNLLDSQITLFNHEIQYYHHLTAYETALAGIEAVVGKRLF